MGIAVVVVGLGFVTQVDVDRNRLVLILRPF